MVQYLTNASVLALAFTGATTFADDGNPSTKVKKLIDESARKRGIYDSDVLNKNPLTADDIPEALTYIKKNAEYRSNHLLHALRKYYPESYKGVSDEIKAAILCSALKNCRYLNDWGYLSPGMSFDDESAQALLKTGKAAIQYLEPILDDPARAPLFGSQAATLSSGYDYRCKDFAYRYTSIILGNKPVFHDYHEDRDKAIETLKAKLKKRDAK